MPSAFVIHCTERPGGPISPILPENSRMSALSEVGGASRKATEREISVRSKDSFSWTISATSSIGLDIPMPTVT